MCGDVCGCEYVVINVCVDVGCVCLCVCIQACGIKHLEYFNIEYFAGQQQSEHKH